MPKTAYSGGQLKFLSTVDVEKIHAGAIRILDDVGVKVTTPAVLEIYRRGGAKVDSGENRVRLPLKVIEKAMQTAPTEILLAGRDESNDLQLAGQAVYAGTGGAELKVIDLNTRQLRDSTLQDVADIARLVDALEHIDFYIRPVVAQDVPQDLLDVNKYYASLANTSKHVMGNVYFREKVEQVVEMAALIAGGEQALRKRPIVSFITSWMLSPLTLNADVTDILIAIAKQQMPVALSSVAILGLTSPVTMAANLALTHAEQLSGIVLCQLVNPGTPVIYGGCPGVADMRDMSFIPGSIERQILNAAITQLAQYIKVPNYNLAGVTDAKIPDIQAGYEKAFGLALTALAGSNYIHHAAGRIKDGVAYEQYVIDNEIIGMAKRAVKGIRVDEDTLAIDEIVAAGPGANFLAREHTLSFFQGEFFHPQISDRKSRSAWEDSGCLDGRERARLEAQRILKDHRPLGIPPEVEAQIRKRFEIILR
ncbi:MAG: trimethylamine methyltransferase family protein [Deltaproteobacteria bacterium]|nr:trimethylamine methyltransferase family protein [Deltaproteobacteria bacterium]